MGSRNIATLQEKYTLGGYHPMEIYLSFAYQERIWNMRTDRYAWWNNKPPVFKYKIPKSSMKRDGKGWKKIEEERDNKHIVSEAVKRKRETAMWAKLLDGKTFT